MIFIYLQLFLLLPYLLFKSLKDKKERGIHLYGIHGYFGLPG